MHKTAIRSTLSIIVLILVLFTFQQIYCSYIRKVRSHLPPFLSVSLRSPISILEQDLIDEHILLDAFSHVRSHSSQNSGILLLLCRKTCRSLKLQLQEWIRLFNSNTNKTASEKVIFYFYAIRQQITRSSKHNGGIFPRVLYVGNESYANYDGALDNKRAFMKFLDDQRRVHIQDIMTVEQLHDILNEACSCNDRKHLIILSNPKRCPLRNFEGIIRNIRNVGEFSFYRLQRPLSTDLSVELFTRLAQLPDVCQIAIVLQNNAYTWTHIGQSSLEVNFQNLTQMKERKHSQNYILTEHFAGSDFGTASFKLNFDKQIARNSS
ncbi:hypothetical protein AB6A40_006947 [Gnathostoma spinigerum]|uniref:Uncharacterized protein n=1 Tax=Gnathostoma spinigerum TaxID=75299 RepID=A0ABD6EK25_9BILA